MLFKRARKHGADGTMLIRFGSLTRLRIAPTQPPASMDFAMRPRTSSINVIVDITLVLPGVITLHLIVLRQHPLTGTATAVELLRSASHVDTIPGRELGISTMCLSV